MAKTQPIGVRFRADIIETLKEQAATPQKVLIFLEDFYEENADKIKDFEAKNEPPVNDFEVKYTEVLSLLNEIRDAMAEKVPANLTTMQKINWQKAKDEKISTLQNKLFQIK
jgi:hypothetical protein